MEEREWSAEELVYILAGDDIEKAERLMQKKAVEVYKWCVVVEKVNRERERYLEQLKDGR